MQRDLLSSYAALSDKGKRIFWIIYRAGDELPSMHLAAELRQSRLYGSDLRQLQAMQDELLISRWQMKHWHLGATDAERQYLRASRQNHRRVNVYAVTGFGERLAALLEAQQREQQQRQQHAARQKYIRQRGRLALWWDDFKALLGVVRVLLR